MVNIHAQGTPDEAQTVDRASDLYRLVQDLYPICRSITGNGVRSTLDIIGQVCPLDIHEVPTGTAVFDWEVPKEWNITDAYIADTSGRRLVDFYDHNLHVLNYSIPIRRTMSLAGLKPHLHTLPDHPDWIPYRTSYYKETWGFCLSHRSLQSWSEGQYEVVIDSSLEPGSLTYGEVRLPGSCSDEVLFYTHICHPSLCNDNLSGIAVLAHLARILRGRNRRLTYRLIFAPGTIGAITWLQLNEQSLAQIRYGLVVGLLGDAGGFTYKRTRHDNSETDQVLLYALTESGHDFTVRDFSPYGYDERQFGSPGINLPIGRLTRTPNGEYPEYHTSADNLSLVSPTQLADALKLLVKVVDILELNDRYLNTNPKCEPQLGRRGLYSSLGGMSDIAQYQHALLWVLNLSDGAHSLLDIAERSGIALAYLGEAVRALMSVGLLKRAARTAVR